MLELYHGPTAAFKDVGASFLAACLTRLEGDPSAPLTILVATSGDTGGAVAAAFDRRPGMRVAVLFPEGRVSGRQEQQLCCWSDNVVSLKVAGAFDDCQALVKSAMADAELATLHRFSSANSINIGRLLPQSTYYADASLRHFRRTGNKAGIHHPDRQSRQWICVRVGTRDGLAHWSDSLSDQCQQRPSLTTLRLRSGRRGAVCKPWHRRWMSVTRAIWRGCANCWVMPRFSAISYTSRVSEIREIERAIKQDYAEFGIATCPHTATATHSFRHLPQDLAAEDWILVATAHPAKFETIVEPLIGAQVPLPPELEEILSRPASAVRIQADLASLAAALKRN